MNKYKNSMASALTVVRRGVDPARLQALKQLQCSIFSTTYNPTNARNGAKYLKGALRGPSMVRYYPPRITFKDIEKMLGGEFGVTDLAEQQRLDDVAARKRRGKGPPKKAKTKGAPPFSLASIETQVLTVLLQRTADVRQRKDDRRNLSLAFGPRLDPLWQHRQLFLLQLCVPPPESCWSRGYAPPFPL
jgi:small subunit ribosomal protein S33